MATTVLDPARELPRAAAEIAPARRRRVPTTTLLLVVLLLLGIGLRFWRTTFTGLTYDETFTAMAGRLPLGRLFEYLRDNDTHPPLDYLIRAPLARAGASAELLRLPSVAFSCAALGVFAWWTRRWARTGLIATALMAASTFQVLHGGEARMYALLELLGVLGAVLAHQWLQHPRRWHAWALAGVVVVASFDHASAVLFGAGLFALAGVRTDPDAWRWRLAPVAAGVVWALSWGPAFLHQAGGAWVSWIAPTSPSTVAEAISSQVTGLEHVATVVALAVVAGGVALWRADRVLARVWLAVGVVPFVAAAIIGLFTPFFVDRALTLVAWAPLLAFGFLGDAIIRRFGVLGIGVVLSAVALVVAGSITFLATKRYDVDLSIDRLEHVTRPGDVIAVRPARYGALVDYRIGVLGRRPVHRVVLPAIANSDALRIGAGSGRRTWLLTPAADTTDYSEFPKCAAKWSDGVTKILCLRVTVEG